MNDQEILKIFIKNNNDINNARCKKSWLNKRPEIKNYLDNRFPNDKFISYGYVIKRIMYKIEILPKCPGCGNKNYNFLGKYCSADCQYHSEAGRKTRSEAQKKFWNNASQEFKDLHSNKTKEGMNNIPDEIWKQAVAKQKISRQISEQNMTQEEKEARSLIYKKAFNTPEMKEMKSISGKNFWKNASTEKKNSIKEAQIQGCIRKHGVTNCMQIPEVAQHISEKQKEKWSKLTDEEKSILAAKTWEKRKLNGTCNSSKDESLFLSELNNIYPNLHIETNYREDKRYPFMCDFYIKEFDLFIELNIFNGHGGHWFNKDNKEDLNKLQELENKTEKENTNYYKNCIYVWTVSDLKKREVAKKNNLNYKVIWSHKELILFIQELKEDHKLIERIFKDYE